jgi:hypothetical protein
MVSYPEILKTQLLEQRVEFLTVQLEILKEHYQFTECIDQMLIDNLHRRLLKLEGYE